MVFPYERWVFPQPKFRRHRVFRNMELMIEKTTVSTDIQNGAAFINPNTENPKWRRERERLQCFSQPASLITYRRRRRSNVENIKTV